MTMTSLIEDYIQTWDQSQKRKRFKLLKRVSLNKILIHDNNQKRDYLVNLEQVDNTIEYKFQRP